MLCEGNRQILYFKNVPLLIVEQQHYFPCYKLHVAGSTLRCLYSLGLLQVATVFSPVEYFLNIIKYSTTTNAIQKKQKNSIIKGKTRTGQPKISLNSADEECCLLQSILLDQATDYIPLVKYSINQSFSFEFIKRTKHTNSADFVHFKINVNMYLSHLLLLRIVKLFLLDGFSW